MPRITLENNEKIIKTAHPALRSYLVYVLGVIIPLAGPVIRPESGFPLWLGALISLIFLVIIIRRLTHAYTLTNQRLVVRAGVFANDNRDMPLAEIENIELNEGFTLRLMNVGHLLVRSSNPDSGPLILFGLSRPREFERLLMAQAKLARN